MKQETLQTRAKRIVKGAKRKLATAPTSRHAIDGEIFWHKKTLISVYYDIEQAGKQSVLVAICREQDVLMPYYLKCIIIDNKEVHRSFCQACYLDIDFRKYNDVLTEVLDETLKLIIKKGGAKKENNRLAF